MDKSEQSRSLGYTITCNTIELSTEQYSYTIVDTPGNKKFIKNMIKEVYQTPAAILVVEDKNVSNIRYPARLLHFLGVKQLLILVNKMDSLNYNKSSFTEITDRTSDILIRVGWNREFVNNKVLFLPISGLNGDNILQEATETMPWWNGDTVPHSTVIIKTLWGALNNFFVKPQYPDKKLPTQVAVSRIYTKNKDFTVLSGYVLQGTLKLNDQLRGFPSIQSNTVTKLEIHNKSVTVGIPGDMIGIQIPKQIKKNTYTGNILTIQENDNLKVCKQFTAQIQSLKEAPRIMNIGYCPIAFVGSGQAACRIVCIKWTKHSCNDYINKNPIMLQRNSIAEVVFEPLGDLIVDHLKNSSILSRVVFVEGCTVVMLGKVIEFV
jgi:elongation factor 1-alpha